MKISLLVGLPSTEAEEDRLEVGAERDLKKDMILTQRYEGCCRKVGSENACDVKVYQIDGTKLSIPNVPTDCGLQLMIHSSFHDESWLLSEELNVFSTNSTCQLWSHILPYCGSAFCSRL